MALKIEELQVLISANADQFHSEIQGISRQLNDLTKTGTVASASMGQLGFAMTAANVASQVVTKSFTAITDAIGDFTKSVITNGTELTRIKIATNQVAQNMGLTKTQVDALRASLSDANTFGVQAEQVIKTLAQSGLIKMAESLSLVDSRTGKMTHGVESLILVMKDLSAAALVDSADGIQRLTKFIRTGNQEYADGIIEIGRINAAYNAFAAKTDRSIQQLSEQEMAQVRVNLVMGEGQKVFGAYAATMGTAGKLFDSIGQKFVQITASIGDALSPIFNTLALGIYTLVSGVQSAVESSAGSIGAFATTIAGYILALFRVIGRLLSMIPVFGANFNALANLQIGAAKTAKSLTEQTLGFGNAADQAAGGAGKLKKELMGLAAFDEMNVLSQPDKGGGAGGMGGIGNMNIQPVDWGAALDTNGINAAADEIMKKFEGVGLFFAGWWTQIVAGFTWLSGMVSGIWSTLGTGLLVGWNQYGAGIMTGITQFAENTKTIFGLVATNVMAIITPFLNALKDVWNQNASGIIASLSKLVGAAISAALSIYNNFIAPIAIWIQSVLRPIFNLIGIWIGNLVYSVGSMIGAIVKTVIDQFTNIMNFIQHIFSGDWANAMRDIINIFKTAFDGILAILKVAINSIIRQLNQFFDSLGSIDIPDYVPGVGGKKFSIAHIPYLAAGGVVNTPTLAMMGEGGYQEAVVPLDRNTGWAEKVAELINNAGGSKGDQPMQLVVQLGEKKIYEGFVDWHNNEVKTTNQQVLIV